MRLLCFSILLLIHTLAAGETLYLSRHADADTRQAAADWARIMTALTGQPHKVAPRPVLLPVREQSIGGIRIGWMGKRPVLGSPDPSASNSGSTAIDLSPEELEAQITASEWIYTYLQEVTGVRWFMPGPNGESLPAQLATTTPTFAEWLHSQLEPTNKDSVRFQSRFISRNISNTQSEQSIRLWALRNRLRERFSFNHQHFRIIQPKHFETNPEWFAKDKHGNSMRPPYTSTSGFNDHPDLSEPSVVEKIASAGLAFFADNPRALSWSDSANDSFEFGHFDPDYPYFDANRWFRRYPDYSNHVFNFSNKVTNKIISAYPGRYIGTLAYLSWENVPDFPVHPQIVPYLTADRSQWFDPDFREQDLALVRKWKNAGPRIIGTWDYFFTTDFFIPRSLSQYITDSIRTLYHEGVRAYFCEVGPLWSMESHTTWLMAQLLWNPQADADALLNEAFLRMYGPAAPHMRALYEHSENIWMNSPGNWRWIKYWGDISQAMLWSPEDLKLLERCLTQASEALAAHGSDAERARLLLAQEAFAVTKTFLHYTWLRAEAERWASEVILSAEEQDSAGGTPLSGKSGYGVDYRHRLQLAEQKLRDALSHAISSNSLHARFQRNAWAFHHDPSPKVDFATALINESIRYGEGKVVSHPPETSAAWRTSLICAENAQILQQEGKWLLTDVRRGQIFTMFHVKPGHSYWVEAVLSELPIFPAEINLRLDWYDADKKIVQRSRMDRFMGKITAPEDKQQKHLLGIWATPNNDKIVYGRLFLRPYEMESGDTMIIQSAKVLEFSRE